MSGTANAAPIIVLAFDFGTRRIGIASGNTLTRMPQPLCTLEYKQQLPWNEIDRLLRDYLPKQLVVGLPNNTDDTPTPLTPVVKAFADELAARSQLPVDLVDERHSSQEAERELAYLRNTGLKTRKVTHADVDKLAAKVVLQRWFDSRK